MPTHTHPGERLAWCTHKKAHRHGTAAAYRMCDCRCLLCRVAYSDSRRAARAGVHALVDATPAREHIRRLLAAGMTHEQIGWDAAVSYRTTVDIGVGKRTRTSREVQAAILTVKPRPKRTAVVDATGTRRRLQALALRGWNANLVATAIGCDRANLARLTDPNGPRRTRIETAQKVAAFTAANHTTPPPTYDKYARTVAERTRTRARKAHWKPLAAWDDIDNPDCTPTGYGRDRTTAPATAEARWRLELGEPLDQIARDLGVDAYDLGRRLEAEATQ